MRFGQNEVQIKELHVPFSHQQFQDTKGGSTGGQIFLIKDFGNL